MLTQRELEARYRGALLGRAWPLIMQVIQLVIFTFVFAEVFRVRFSIAGATSSPLVYGLWLFTGLIVWNAFSAALGTAPNAILASPHLVKRVIFPIAVIPLVTVTAPFVESAVGTLVAIVAAVIILHTLNWTIVLLPLLWIPQLLLTSGLAYALAGLSVFLRDTAQAVQPILMMLFYLTPIVYPVSALPHGFGQLLRYSPITLLVDGYRDVLLDGSFLSIAGYTGLLLFALVIFVAGVSFFRRVRPAFVDVI
jgi:lipopolysaccharide transport system permease protein